MRRHQPRVSNFAAGIIGAGRGRRRLLLHLRRDAAVLGLAVRAQGGVHEPDAAAHPLAGPDRRGRRRSGRLRHAQSTSSARPSMTMDIDKNGLPIHADATAKIRSRIFLEGNFYVDLAPGHAERSGAVAPARRCRPPNTSGPVQLDRVLVGAELRRADNLQTLLQGLGARSTTSRPPAEDASQDPIVRSLTGGQALNTLAPVLGRRVPGSAIVNQALLGTEPHDLTRSSSATRRCSEGSPPAASSSRASSPRSTRRWPRSPRASRI